MHGRAAIVASAASVLPVLLFVFCPLSLKAAEPVPPVQPLFITIGTGPLHGLYYPAAHSICNLLNSEGGVPGFLCSVERTSGSIYNLKALAAGEFEFCISQSDQLVAASAGTGEFKDALGDLRTVFPLFEETLTVVVRADGPIRSIADLKHKKISTGLPGSGGYATMHKLMKSQGWSFYDIEQVDTISNARALMELCKNKLDVVVFTAGHPYSPLVRAADACDLRLLKVRGPAIRRLVSASSAYSRTVIPGGLYRGVVQPVKSVGVMATLVSSSVVDSSVVYRVVKNLMEHMDEFRHACPVFGSVTRNRWSGRRWAVPLHDGAARYYREAGLTVRAGGYVSD